MTESGSSSENPNSLINVISGYLGQAVQILTALVGLTSLFYALGFLFVNIRLLWLGLFETGLVKVGYLVPGLAFGIICLMVLVWTILVFDICEHIFTGSKWAVWLVGIVTVSAGAWLLAYSLWFWKSVSLPVGIWLNALAIAMALVSRAAHQKPHVQEQLPDEIIPRIAQRVRLSLQESFAAVNILVAVVAILTYGYFIYAEIPPVYGGGQPIVVRFFGEKVGQLSELGIDLEPGETQLTRRVELISQTSDRYIVRLGNKAVTFDKSFVQGMSSEPPEFFLDDEAFMLNHVTKGQQFYDDQSYDLSLSEFNRALSRNDSYVPALQGRVLVYMAQKKYTQAREDYAKLTDLEPENGDPFYGLAVVLVLQTEGVPSETLVDEVVSALESAFAANAALIERARADPDFNPLRGALREDLFYFEAFDNAVYGSGAGAARWYREKARSLTEDAEPEASIAAFQASIAYALEYQTQEDALTANEIADLDVALSRKYLEIDRLSADALAALIHAVEITSEQDPTYLRELADLYQARNENDEARDYYSKAIGLSNTDDPDWRLTLIGQGHAELESKNYPAAVAAFEQAFPVPISSEQDAAALYDYARALAILGYPETTTTMNDALRRAIELDPTLAERAATTDWAAFFSKAGTSVENLINGAKSFKEARELRDKGELENAILAYQQATATDPDVFRYWRELGDALKQAGRNTEAISAYQAALLRSGEEGRPALLTSLASLQLSAGDAPGAVASLTQAINLQADNTPDSTYALLARAYEAQSIYDQAAAAYKQASLIDPSKPQYLYYAGIDWLLFGENEKGLGALNGVLTQGWLRVESADGTRLREGASPDSATLTTLGIGAQLRISGNPIVVDGTVWWPVLDREGIQGWVRASSVIPGLPPDTESVPSGE